MNYLKHLGLRELPFGITPDTSYFFASRSIQEATPATSSPPAASKKR
jgi:hypothetical protein